MEEITKLKVGQERMNGEMKLIEQKREQNHTQNRQSIHELRNQQEEIFGNIGDVKEELSKKIDTVNTELSDEIGEVKRVVTKLDLRFAKLGGYAVGAGAGVGTVVSLIVKGIEHWLK